MNPILCPHEAHVSHSAPTGWDDLTRAHIAECAHCREVAQIAEYMRNIAGIREGGNALPEAEQVWLTARILAIQAARERALRPLVIAEIAVRAALILALVAGITWLWSSFQSIAAGWLTMHSKAPQPILLSIAALMTCLSAFVFIKLIQPILAVE